jgi:hypothetical protein
MAAKEPVSELKDAKEIRILAFSDARIVSGRTQSTAGFFKIVFVPFKKVHT